ncbi:MAG: alcohol dehydrogenase catalytic domain-containing protein, partial [Minisyncoccia bacterium]
MKFIQAQFRSAWKTRLVETERPTVAEDHYLLKVEACTFCGSDFDVLSSGLANWTPLGHEISARILESPSNARSDLRKGDRVAVELTTMCGFCEDCRGGRPASCDCCPPLRVDALGGFAEIITAP